jgi:hypothetical protein
MTHSGDTIDLTQLPMSCSKITLTQHNAILVSQDVLYLQGPGADSLSIDANAESGVFLHLGAGTLYVSDVTIANGNLSASTSVGGGCVASAGSVFLNDAVVTSCQLTSTSGTANDSAKGGGIYVSHSLFMIRSKISDSHASTSSLALARGGGAYAYENIVALDSTIVGNSATTQAAIFTEAGGFRAKGTADIERSTISGNSAQYYGALRINGGFISDSTISGNSADKFYGGVGSGGALTISNSTIAFNHARQPALGSGLYAWGTLTLTSSIIADNTGPGGSTDLYAFLGNVTAHDNLVVSSNIALPLDNTVGVCPKLDILANSGGFTATHGLLTDSPAIDHGSGTVTVDQRGLPRMSGAAVDIGAFERQPTDKPDRIFTNGLEGFCDQ